jgi:2'-5' RNA ligase
VNPTPTPGTDGPLSGAPTDVVEVLRNHWWWRPGWQVGTRYYTWHITVDTLPGLAGHIAAYQAALAPLPTLDMVPRPWLHMTVQGVGHTHDVPDEQLHGISDSVASRLGALPAFTAKFGAPGLHTEAVVLHPADPAPFHGIRRAIRAGLADVLGDKHVPESDRFRPHVSAAYVNADTPADVVRLALSQVDATPVQVPVTVVSLIEIHRDQRMYQWHNTERHSLASLSSSSPSPETQDHLTPE